MISKCTHGSYDCQTCMWVGGVSREKAEDVPLKRRLPHDRPPIDCTPRHLYVVPPSTPPPASPRAVSLGQRPLAPLPLTTRIGSMFLWWRFRALHSWVRATSKARRAWSKRKAFKWKDVPQRPGGKIFAPPSLIMQRCHLFTTPWGNEYVLHLLLNSDNMALGLHDHPWDFWSIVLWGGYTEEWLPDWVDPTSEYWQSFTRIRYRGLLSFSRHPAKYMHAIVGLRMRRPCLTLCRQSKRRPEGWGFPSAGVKGS